MKKTYYTLVLALCVFTYIVSSCKQPAPAVPVSERIKKSYTAESVTENGTVVFSRSGTSTKPGYSQFLLDLSSPPAVRYRDVDGTLFTGTYAVVNDTDIVLSKLTPEPTGTNGTITFRISDLADGTVTLSRPTVNPKTGNTTNVYKLRS